MKKCNSCNIKFNISDKYCPLCQNILIGKEDDLLFPKNNYYKTYSFVLRILIFVSFVIFLTSGFFELMITKSLNITFYVGLGLITNYVIIYFIFKNYQNIFRMFGRYGLIIVILLIIWYLVTKSKIITNYVIPIICIFELLFNFILGIILRKKYLIKYSDQLLMNIFLLFIPIILVWFKQTSNNIMAYICCLLSIISISGLLIFFFEEIKEELTKIFNV